MPTERSRPLISIICPVRNEIGFIDRLVKFLVQVQPEAKECIFADGGSTDGTLQVLQKYTVQYPDIIRVVHNPHRFIPHALNIAITKCRADKICRIDAHSLYAEDYFEQILKTFFETGADIVGGVSQSAGTTTVQRATAKALSSVLGAGNSKYRLAKFRGFTEHVSFGAWKREVIHAIGGFDEDLLRNQDEEFQYRAKGAGFKVYSDPDIRLWHHPRETISELFQQYYRYGFYKPLVSFKVKSEMKIRHFIPGLFTTYLLLLPIALLSSWFLAPLGIYLMLVLFFAIKLGKGFNEIDTLLLVFPAIHTAYGLGYMAGLPNALVKRSSRIHF